MTANQEMDRQDKRPAGSPLPAERLREGRVFRPDCDIYETGEALHVLADMPGVSQQDLDVSLEDRVLTIRGRVGATAPEGMNPAWHEYETGGFERSFEIGETIDAAKIGAAIKDGVLHVTLPFAAQARTRRIPVEAR